MAAEIHKEYLLGDFLMEPASHVLKRHGVPVSLNKKRFQVLVYLIDNRDRLVPRQELLDGFWDGSEVYEENLTKCVSEIRKALDDQKKPHQFIETVPAVGYRYIGPFSEEVRPPKPSVFAVEKVRGVKVVVEEDDGLNDVSERRLPAERRAPAAIEIRPESSRRRSWLLPTALACAILVATAIALIVYRSRSRAAITGGSEPIRSIAVLPFKNLSGNQAEDYYGDGMTESLITSLSKIEGLKVISSSSVFHFKGQEVDPREVGRQLNVGAILEGTVRKDPDSIRVAVRLVSADDGHVLWVSDTNDKALHDLFGLQDEIARQVAAGLRVTLNATGEQRLTKRYTENSEAYQLYLKGRYFWDKRSAEQVKKAIEQFEQATKKDPNYALAYAGLADCYAVLGADAVYPERESYEKAKALAERAVQIDDSLGEAHATLASIYDFLWQWDEAEKEFKRALELNSNYANVHHWYSFHFRNLGHFEDSLAEARRAVELDPLSVVLNMSLAQAFLAIGDTNAAIEQSKKAIDLNPAADNTVLALAYLKEGKRAEALAELPATSESPGRKNPRLGRLGYVYAVVGKRGEALAIVKELEADYQKQEAIGFYIAEVYAGLGDKDGAFSWLEKDFQARSGRLPEIRWQLPFESLRSDPRYTDLLRRVGLASS